MKRNPYRTANERMKAIRSLFSMIQKLGSDGIPPSSMKRMATQQAAHRACRSFQNAITFDGLDSIFRTRGCEAARGTDPGRNQQLVASEKSEGNFPADQSRHEEIPSSDSNSVLNSSYSRLHADCRGFTTISTPRGREPQASRKISRTRLRIRLR